MSIMPGRDRRLLRVAEIAATGESRRPVRSAPSSAERFDTEREEIRSAISG